MDIYEEFDRRTGSLSAYAILKDGRYVGRAVFLNKTACTCYFQIWGAAMQKGIAHGGNYDRHSAAAENATAKLEPIENRPDVEEIRKHVLELLLDPELEGLHWYQRLERNGYEISSVI